MIQIAAIYIYRFFYHSNMVLAIMPRVSLFLRGSLFENKNLFH